MQLKNAVVLVTGANRGIGAEFVAQLKGRGAAKIYAASRNASTVRLCWATLSGRSHFE